MDAQEEGIYSSYPESVIPRNTVYLDLGEVAVV